MDSNAQAAQPGPAGEVAAVSHNAVDAQPSHPPAEPPVPEGSAVGQIAAVGASPAAEAGGPSQGAPGEAAQDSRPSDEAILSFENQLKEEQRQKPLLGDKVGLDVLTHEYQDGSPIFLAKISSLMTQFEHLRQTRKDGNCFYRSFLFGTFENILTTRNLGAGLALRDRVQQWHSKLLAVGYQAIVFEDAMQYVVELLNDIIRAEFSMTPNELLVRLQAEDVSNMIIMLVRLITSAEIQRRTEHFTPFIAGMTDTFMLTEEFCRRFVENMGEESDHIQLVAAADAFQVPIKVVYLDNSGLMGGSQDQLVCEAHEFVPVEGVSTPGVHMPQVTLLYRPGHYDIVYSR